MIKKFSNKLVLTLLALMVGTVANAAVKLSLTPLSDVTPGNEYTVAVIVESDVALASVGFDVKFPKGITPIEMVKNNDRAKGTNGWICNITESKTNPGFYTAGLTNFTKDILAGNDAVAYIKVETAGQIGKGEIEIENVEIVLAGETEATEDFVVETPDVTTTTIYPGVMTFFTDDYIVAPGAEFTVAVNLLNDAALRSFQCDVVLPEGFTLVEDEEEGDIFVGSERNPNPTSYMFNATTNVLGMFVTSKDQIEGNDGVLFTFKVKAPAEMPAQSVISLKNFRGVSVQGFNTSFELQNDLAIAVLNERLMAIPGDIDKDGDVDADDLALFIQALAAQQLPTVDSDDFVRYDANQNGVINIADAQAIFNIFMYGNAAGR